MLKLAKPQSDEKKLEAIELKIFSLRSKANELENLYDEAEVRIFKLENRIRILSFNKEFLKMPDIVPVLQQFGETKNELRAMTVDLEQTKTLLLKFELTLDKIYTKLDELLNESAILASHINSKKSVIHVNFIERKRIK